MHVTYRGDVLRSNLLYISKCVNDDKQVFDAFNVRSVGQDAGAWKGHGLVRLQTGDGDTIMW